MVRVGKAKGVQFLQIGDEVVDPLCIEELSDDGLEMRTRQEKEACIPCE